MWAVCAVVPYCARINSSPYCTGASTLGLVSFLNVAPPSSTPDGLRGQAVQFRHFEAPQPQLPPRGFPGHGESKEATPPTEMK
jgi:hypothetical protein